MLKDVLLQQSQKPISASSSSSSSFEKKGHESYAHHRHRDALRNVLYWKCEACKQNLFAVIFDCNVKKSQVYICDARRDYTANVTMKRISCIPYHMSIKYIFSSRPKLHEDHAHAPFYLFLWMGMSPRSVELHSPNWFRHDLLNYTSSIKHREQNRTAFTELVST